VNFGDQLLQRPTPSLSIHAAKTAYHWGDGEDRSEHHRVLKVSLRSINILIDAYEIPLLFSFFKATKWSKVAKNKQTRYATEARDNRKYSDS
jgi:hypothetical protein